jgi:hypothetical protein
MVIPGIGAAVTQWAMIDLTTRRPIDLSVLANKSTSLLDKEPPIERPRKVGAIEGETVDVKATPPPHESATSASEVDIEGTNKKTPLHVKEGCPKGGVVVFNFCRLIYCTKKRVNRFEILVYTRY